MILYLIPRREINRNFLQESKLNIITQTPMSHIYRYMLNLERLREKLMMLRKDRKNQNDLLESSWIGAECEGFHCFSWKCEI